MGRRSKISKSWQAKLADCKDLPKCVPIPKRMEKSLGKGMMAIPSPLEVNEVMSCVPEGKLTTINQVRAAIACKHNATIGCPMTTGIFAWIAAYAAEERVAAGQQVTNAWWRTLKSTGELNPKYPGGVEEQARRLENEGHEIIKPGNSQKLPYVANLEPKLATLKFSY